MTGKRFTLEEFGLNFIVNDNGRNLTAKQTVDKLNQLYEENEQLKEDLHNIQKAQISDIQPFEELLTEIEKLKSICQEIESTKLLSSFDHRDHAIDFKADSIQLEKENKELKEVLGSILREVKRDISNTNQTGEIKVFINPDYYDMISEILRKYNNNMW